MSEKMIRKGNTGVMVLVKILALIAMVSSAVMLVQIMQDTDAPGSLWVLNILMADPIILFVVYLFTGYSKNKNKLLGAYFVVSVAAMMLSNFVFAYQYVQTLMYDLYSTDLWSSYDTHYWLQSTCMSLSINIFTMFAIDAFLNFRMVKASRVLSVVSAATTVIFDFVMWDYYSYDYPDVYWMIRWLMPLCLIAFYFGGVDKYRPDPKPVYAPVHTYAPAAPPQPMGYAPTPTYAPAPMPTQLCFCSQCGSPLYGPFCSNCGSRKENVEIF